MACNNSSPNKAFEYITINLLFNYKSIFNNKLSQIENIKIIIINF